MNHYLLNPCKVVASVDNLIDDILNTTYFCEVDIEKIRVSLHFLYPALMQQYDNELKYVKSIHWFIAVCQELKGDSYAQVVEWRDDSIYMFISKIQGYRSEYISDRLDFSNRAQENSVSLETYLNNLIEHHSRLLFVRVDLKYSKELSYLIEVEDFYYDIERLRQRISNKRSYLKGRQGFAWALEQGFEDGGLHCHLLLIYDGAKHQNAWYLAKEVGEIWRAITKGNGTYFNCHDTQYLERYKRSGTLGVEKIHRSNNTEVKNAIRTALYLTDATKYNQRLKIRFSDMKTFGHGIYRNTKRRGLPPITK